jgi:serine/threonine protein kinase
MVGKVVGRRYRLVYRLGRGSCATVYLSRAEDTGEIFAVKVFGTPATSTEVLQRFSQELQQVASRGKSIDAPQVVHIYDSGWDEQAAAPFLVTEYVPGHTLAALIRHTRPLPIPVALGIGHQVALGLAAIHAQDIAHGNLQPHQILITPQGVIRLTDFGLAHLIEICGWSSSELWSRDAWLFYLTVEQIVGRDVVGDAYALGSLLYHMLIGDVPFAGYELASLSQAIQSTGPELMTAARPGIPAEVDELVRRCMGRSLATQVGQMTPGQAAGAIASLPTVKPATNAEIAAALQPLWIAGPESTQLKPCLYIVRQDRRVILDQPKVTLGRRDPSEQIFPDIDLIDLDPGRVLHRQHAEVYREGSTWFIRALHRDARLQVNDSRVKYDEPRPLAHGDQITLSRQVELIFEIGEVATD